MGFFKEAMARIKKVTGTRTQVELAHLLEIKQSSISSAKRRNTIPSEWRMKLFEKFGVNPDWIKKGEGPIFLRTEYGYIAADQENQFDPALLDTPNVRPRLASVFGMHLDASLRPVVVGKISLASSFARPGILIMKCDACSLAPTIMKGAYIGVDEHDKNLVSGEIFAIHVHPRSIMILKAYYDGDSGQFLLRAESPDQPDIKLSPEELEQALLGKVVWVLQIL